MTLDEIYRQRLAVWSDIVDHLEFIHDFTVERNAQTVVELGVRSGNSTAALLAAVEQTGGHLWSCDIRLPSAPAVFHESGLWTFVLGDDLTVADQLPAPIDVLFIDSSHFYEHTLAELRLYGPKAETILLHDTELEHPDGAPEFPPFPVARAVEAWCREVGREWTNRTGCYGLGVIGG